MLQTCRLKLGVSLLIYSPFLLWFTGCRTSANMDTTTDMIIIDCGGGVIMELVRIPAGTFMMGTEFSDSDLLVNSHHSRPVHQVTIDYDFYMGKYEVTQAQYQAVTGTNPSRFKGDLNRPVDQVSWHDAVAFCKALSAKTGYNIRLPSEAEWEYACKAGSGDTKYHFGNDESQLGDYAWYMENSSFTTHSVGQKLPNNFGLYDMHGNVREWCQDTWHDNYIGAPNNGNAWETLSERKRVVRGGSWFGNGHYCRSADRYGDTPTDKCETNGFRVVSQQP